MAPIAATSITIMTIMITMTTSTITPMRLMDAPSPDPRSAAPFRELPLLVWLSPAFPVGSFAYSHGLEWAAEAGDIVDAASLQRWLLDLIELGAPRTDCVLFAPALRPTGAADLARIA